MNTYSVSEMGEECDENLLGHKGPKIGVIENVAFWKKKKCKPFDNVFEIGKRISEKHIFFYLFD